MTYETEWGPWTLNDPEDVRIDPEDGVIREALTKTEFPRLYQNQHYIKTKRLQGLVCWEHKPGYNKVLMYREYVKPVVEKVSCFAIKRGRGWYMNPNNCGGKSHKITFKTIDGEPDCSSIVMEKLNEEVD